MKSFYRYYNVTIGAGASREINVQAKFMAVLSWDGTNKALIRVGDQPEENFPAGVAIKLPNVSGRDEFFGKVIIRNDNVSSAILEIAFSDGEIYDNRLTLSGTVFDNLLAEARGETAPQGFGLVTIGTAVTLAVASNTDRKSVLIQNPPTNTGLMYVGFDNTLLSTKYACVLSAGQIFSCDDYRGDIYCLGTVAGEKISYGEV